MDRTLIKPPKKKGSSTYLAVARADALARSKERMNVYSREIVWRKGTTEM